MNILLSCVGRRSYLVDYFKKALIQEQGIVIGTNSVAFTAGMFACDKSFVVPEVTNKDYIPTLLDIAMRENVSMIVSLFDIDLLYLAKSKDMFSQHGITIVVSSEEVIDIANDKWKTYAFLKENNIKTPTTFICFKEALNALKRDKLKYPVYVKPRFGMGSIGVYKADDENELSFFYNYVKKQIKQSYLNKLSSENLDEVVLIQENIHGVEYGIDIFNNLEGQHLISVVKEKIAMRFGETDASIVVNVPDLSTLSLKISTILKHVGNLDIDVLFDGNDYYVLEMNARFGGGFPFSYLAGADFPKMLIKMLKNEKINIPNIKEGTRSLKSIVPIRLK
ncbi:MAG: ATP-grasp domain-containing protein [Bacteroidales bacterium]|nr:ATP-grasp domain-containing protein [Bacteroidales bacterium]